MSCGRYLHSESYGSTFLCLHCLICGAHYKYSHSMNKKNSGEAEMETKSAKIRWKRQEKKMNGVGVMSVINSYRNMFFLHYVVFFFFFPHHCNVCSVNIFVLKSRRCVLKIQSLIDLILCRALRDRMANTPSTVKTKSP